MAKTEPTAYKAFVSKNEDMEIPVSAIEASL
jgi:hypothetical protein